MKITTADVMRRIRHYFVAATIVRQWHTEGGVLYPTDAIAPGSYIAVSENGPRGVYRLDENGRSAELPNRQWTGPVSVLQPPADFLALCDEISQWAEKNDPAVTRESFGEYSVQRENTAWESAFAAALAPYMRMYPEVKV